MIKNKTVAYILYILVFFTLWFTLEYLFVTFISHGSFSAIVWDNLYVPAVCAITTGYLTICKKA